MTWFYGDNLINIFHDESPYHHIGTTPLFSRAKRWTGFYMKGTSVMKELMWTELVFLSLPVTSCLPFKRQPHRMVKPNQAIRRQIADELLECVWPFCGVGA